MLSLSIFILALICSALSVYFFEYLGAGILYWTIPLYLLAYFLGILILFLFVLYIITLFRNPHKPIDRPKKFYRFFINMAAEFLVNFLRLDLVVTNKDLLPQDDTFLMVSNHQSNVDPIATVWAFHEFNLTYIMKDNIMKLPLLGRFLYGGGFLPLNRKNNRKALETVLTATKRLSNGVHSVAIYPEGTRSRGPQMGPFRNGSFKIALKSKKPIVILAVWPTYKVKSNYPLKRTKIYLDVIEVLNYEDYQDLNTNELGNYVHNLIEERLNKQ